MTNEKAVGKLVEVENYKKIKGILHWVNDEEAMDCEVREYGRLFNEPFPGKKTGNFLDDINKESKFVYPNAKFNKNLLGQLKVEDRL